MFVCGECGQRYERGGYCANDGKPIDATDDPLLGTDVGRYRLAALVGEGGMGRVYLAVQPAIGSRVAIKILSDQCAQKPDLLERFFAEAKAVNLIRHESIVSVIDLARLDDGRPYIVMEYIAGSTLGPLVHGGTAPLGGIVQVFGEVLSALEAAHAIGIVHRDLKPDNIVVTREGHAKVLDFGIAKLAPGLSHLSPRTRTGALLGTPAYMAPEQISGGGAIDPRTDVYAAGIVLFEAVTGRVPFQGETLFDLMKQHLELAPPPPSSLRADLPVAFDRVIARALAKSPDDRFQSAAAMAEALRHAATDLPPQQWHALSRGGVIHGGNRSITRVQPQPTPIRIKRESVEPATVAGRPQRREIDPAATVPAVPVRRRRRGAAIAAIMALATIAGLAIVIARRSHDDPVVAGSAVDPGSAVAGSAVDPGSAVVASTVDPGSAVVGSAVDPGSGAVAGSTVTGTAVVGGRARGPGVIVASGGSAADHGVTHGPGVTSRNVIVGTQTRPSTRLAIDYDPKHFDPIAYLPKARALARRVYPDAELTEFELYENVRSDGVVDLTLPTESTSYYEFRSPAHSVFPRGGKPGDEIFCYVMVDISATEVRTRLRDDDRCDRTLRGAPRCSLARVWRNALAGGVPADKPATVAFLSDGKWFFDPDHAHGGKVMSFGDCP